MNHHLYFAGAGMALLAPLLASCEQKGPSKILQAEIVSALENVEDKASADEAAQLINEAYREYKKEKIDMEQNQKRLRELLPDPPGAERPFSPASSQEKFPKKNITIQKL